MKTKPRPKSAPKPANWYREHFGDHKLRQMPRGDLSTYVPAEIAPNRGKPVLLVSVDNCNKLPKRLRHNVQFMFSGWEPNVNKYCLIGSDGVIHYVQPSY